MIQPASTANQFLAQRHIQAFQTHMEIIDKYFNSFEFTSISNSHASIPDMKTHGDPDSFQIHIL